MTNNVQRYIVKVSSLVVSEATASTKQQAPSSAQAPAATPAQSSGNDTNSPQVTRITTTITTADDGPKKSPKFEKNTQSQQKTSTLQVSKSPSPVPSSSSPTPGSSAPAPGLLQRSTSTALLSTDTTVQPMTQDSQGFTTEDSIEDRVTLKNWDPVSVVINKMTGGKLKKALKYFRVPTIGGNSERENGFFSRLGTSQCDFILVGKIRKINKKSMKSRVILLLLNMLHEKLNLLTNHSSRMAFFQLSGVSLSKEGTYQRHPFGSKFGNIQTEHCHH